ncbi:MAG: STAS domain-containing protein [Bacteroidetes bacterium]|nr:STAS domain-containing protein [Bacteroidota bacterium]
METKSKESINECGRNSLMMKEAQPNKIRFSELFQLRDRAAMNELPGVYIHGIHYYDFKNVHFINNTGIASLIDLLKCLLEKGIEIEFVNVSDSIKSKIKSMGLENILHCR